MAPAIIKPIRCGILNLFRIMGANKMIKSMVEKIRTGFFNGSEKLSILSKIKIIESKPIYHYFLEAGKDNLLGWVTLFEKNKIGCGTK
jgi:hypothetical protein